jgi:hypothetical protein
MDDALAQFVSNLVGRWHGPFWFRFLLQPSVAMIYAVRDGLADARDGRPPYFWSIFTRSHERRQLLREGWKAVTRVIVLGLVMDALYQVIEFRWIHPLELIVVVLGLAFVPYLLLRGPVERIATWWTTRTPATPIASGRETDNAHHRTDRTGRGRYA